MTRRSHRGRHGAATFRRRRIVAGATVLVVAVAVVGVLLARDRGVERVCTRPEGLRTHGDVRLIPEAMDAFLAAEDAVGRAIEVGESFRSCHQQALACERICGSRGGCPGTCAPPGLSWHQRGQAIDVTQGMLDTPGVVAALEDAGWCQAVPDTDPGHFSFDGCH